ncbi:MAG: ABC transporter ATP-binding protein [Clostridiales bacterium]|nr:ABC transporter ATP-binding protein [Clostridiales bacterium]
MKRIFIAYKDLLVIMFKESPFTVILCFICTVINGLLPPLAVYVNQNIFDGGLSVARGEMAFSDYTVFLVLLVVVTILPSVLEGIIFSYIEPRSQLMLKTTYKALMLEKLKTLKYEHFESEASSEIIDKAYNRAYNSVRHLWPMFVFWHLSSLISSIGTLYYVFSIRWWLLLTVLIPFILETYILTKNYYNIYEEMETYWKKERKYSILGSYLRSRDYTKELKAYGNSDYLIGTYGKRLNERNREYERYYFKHLRKRLFGDCITKFGAIINIIILLVLFVNRQISVGLFIAATSLFFGGIYLYLGTVAYFFKWSGMHIKTYEYYDKYFALSDESEGTAADLPEKFDIEFRDVWFRYPGTERDILKGLTFKISHGMKASIVGENGEGKSTMVKLLLGLFTPDKGEILVGGRALSEYPMSVRTKIFGPVFQDFSRFSVTVKENIGIGDVDKIDDDEKIKAAAKKGKVDEFVEEFENGYDTLLGRDFESGVDISGGQWQRIAIARAFMGDKPILLLDEPTSQLDPMAEANLYREFSEMVENKTSIFITHRLGSTMITDRIFVIQNGKIEEDGTHEELMKTDGVYSRMFNSQKQWYKHDNGVANNE